MIAFNFSMNFLVVVIELRFPFKCTDDVIYFFADIYKILCECVLIFRSFFTNEKKIPIFFQKKFNGIFYWGFCSLLILTFHYHCSIFVVSFFMLYLGLLRILSFQCLIFFNNVWKFSIFFLHRLNYFIVFSTQHLH